MNYDHTQMAPLYLILAVAVRPALAGVVDPGGGAQILLACIAGVHG